MAELRQPPESRVTSHRGGRRLLTAAVLVASAELLHAVLTSITVGSLYPVAAFRFAAISTLAPFVVLARSNSARWLLVVLGGIWALGYVFQAASRLGFALAVIAALLAAGV